MRITQEQIDAILHEAEYQIYHRVFEKYCIVVARLNSGFVISGESACIDPANYDEQLGFKYAKERIANKLWELEGYALQKCLAGEL
jgi:Phage protein (N4 Gp49/phage Sf6 gene 66) family